MSSTLSHIPRLDCGVLVLGAGLAGMRAAWAAKQAAPRQRVLLVSPRAVPSGSSFANRNNALGVQAPPAHEAEAFVAEALALAPPGEADPELVRALAADAPTRVAELADIGVGFRVDSAGAPLRFPGCFSPARRALVFDGLARAHAAFSAKLRDLGVETLCGFEALDLPRDHGGRVLGARLCALRGRADGGARLDVRAGAVIAALGGPAPLFARRMCGPGGSGLGLGLLASTGARLVNARFVQFFWLREGDRAFVNPGDLDWSDASCSAGFTALADIAALADSRRGHCPVAFGLPDAKLDLALLARRGPDGVVRGPGAPAMALYAHAGNGGAKIDTHGRTTIPGLFACGECAGGMHGANRLGGAMALACLVFGARAGATAADEAAADEARNLPTPAPLPFAPPPLAGPGRDVESAPFLRRLRRGMDKCAAPGGSPSPAFTAWLRDAAGKRGESPVESLDESSGESPAALRRRLLARSALAVLEE